MDFTKMSETGQLTNIKPCMKITDLETDEKYNLVDIKAVKTKFGRKIVAECEEFITYLPSRFDELSDEDLNQLKKSDITKWCLKCTGVKDCGNGKQTRLIEFVEL